MKTMRGLIALSDGRVRCSKLGDASKGRQAAVQEVVPE
jgi:hypothetical protein